jgi:RimJ/RimL family protein N-acetyltransferase
MEEVGSGTPVGWILLCRLEPAPHAAIGFEVRRSFWNRGYATEATRAVIEHVFTKTEEPALSGLVFVNNPASQRVFEKAGFQTIGRCECEGHPCIQYEIGAQQWRSGRSI